MYIINYVDNQGVKRTHDSVASCFTNAVSEVEKEANEQGHGVKMMTVTREGES